MWLYLFDIDGTLVHSGGAGRRAIEIAFARVWDRAIPVEEYRRVRFNGRSDMAILRDVAAIMGIDGAAYLAREEELIAVYLEALPGAVASADSKRSYTGVPELLEALAGHESVRLALLTGNLEAGARAKLAPFDLNRFFPSGGYGSDAMDRGDIARIARERAEAHYARRFPPSHVVVLGDTPADTACARANGFHAVLVGTGTDPEEELHASAPDLYFKDFRETARVLDALFGRFPPDPAAARASS